MAFCIKDFGVTFPALHLAARINDCKAVKSLLERVDVDSKASDNSTALHIASMDGHLEVVKLLLENKANINAKKDEGFTPLHLAIQYGHFEVSEFLIESGANVNRMDDQNWTPLHIAANNGFSLKLVKDLVAKGTDINARLNDGRNSLHLAAENSNLEIVNFLIENGADGNAVDTRNWTPLHCAVFDGYLEVAESLLDQMVDIDINAKSFKGTAPLHFAVDRGHIDVVHLLLERGADINVLDHTNWSPLHFAANNGFYFITTELLKCGADVNVIENKSNATALHCAAQFGYSEIVKSLIVYGADVNARMNNNVTPLHLGAETHNFDTVKSLLMNGSYFDARAEADGFRSLLPIYFAERTRRRNCLLFGRQEDSAVINLLKLVEELFKAVQENNYLEVENCIKGGVIIDSTNTDGRTPLHFAVNNGHTGIVSILLTNKADVTKVTNRGNTPLHTAVSKGYKDIVNILLQHVNHDKLRDFIDAQTTVAGNTALHVAARNDFFDIGKSLLMYGAIYNIKNKNGETPLDVSQNQNLSDLLTLVEELFEDAKSDNLVITDKILERVNLLNKLRELEVCLVSNISNEDNKIVVLYPDSIYNIAEYIPNSDLINFILAFYKIFRS